MVMSDPRRPGDARVAEGMHVWAIIGQLRLNGGSIPRTADDYGIPFASVDAAITFYEQHKVIIDGRLAEHAAFFAHGGDGDDRPSA